MDNSNRRPAPPTGPQRIGQPGTPPNRPLLVVSAAAEPLAPPAPQPVAPPPFAAQPVVQPVPQQPGPQPVRQQVPPVPQAPFQVQPLPYQATQPAPYQALYQPTQQTTQPTIQQVAAPAAATRTVIGSSTATQQRPAPLPAPLPAAQPAAQPAQPILRPQRPPAVPAPDPAPTPTKIKPRAADIFRELTATQAVCWQIAVFGVLFTIRQPWPVIAAVSVAAVLLLATTVIRVKGRWLYQHLALRLKYFLRSRRFDLPMAESRSLALLERLLPGTSIHTMDTGQDSVMVLSQRRGLTVLIRPEQITPEMIRKFPAPSALLPEPDSSTGVSTEFGIQTVFHSGTKPGEATRLWLAVHAERTADTPVDHDLALGLRNALRRIRKALRRTGIDTDGLNDSAALGTISALAHVTGSRREVREYWQFLSTGMVAQACFRLDSWEKLDDPTARRLTDGMLVRHRGNTGVAITLTCYARSDLGTVRAGAILRLAATNEKAIEDTSTALRPLLQPCGISLSRLDGEHLAGLATSLPIGGFVS